MDSEDIQTRFLERTEFSSYEDFKANYRLKVPANFNFAFDVVDTLAVEDPGRRALVTPLHEPDEEFVAASARATSSCSSCAATSATGR